MIIESGSELSKMQRKYASMKIDFQEMLPADLPQREYEKIADICMCVSSGDMGSNVLRTIKNIDFKLSLGYLSHPAGVAFLKELRETAQWLLDNRTSGC